MKAKYQYILWFKEIRKDDIPLVGGKGANLGEMISFGIPVPDGFVVTSQAYYDFLDQNNFRPKISEICQLLDPNDPQTFNEVSQKIKKLILSGKIPKEISRQIIDTYFTLGKPLKQALVAVRSSATAEDLPDASFAGQQATFLNVLGEANVVEAVKNCWASLFEPRAIFYRQEKGFDHLKVGIAVPIQEMIPSEISGVMFTIDPVTNDKSVLVIEAIYGLGEYIVQGKVTPDRYLLEKEDLKIINVTIAKQNIQLVKVGALNKETNVPSKRQSRRKLSDSQIKELAGIGLKIHRHYYFPQDIEWAFCKNKIWILQTRPVTTINDTKKEKITEPKVERETILEGLAASPGIVSGEVRIINSAARIGLIKKDEILVTQMTSPDFVPAMKKAVGIITDRGGQTSHAAIVSRELGIPCIVGTGNATKILKNGQIITIDGGVGKIYKGGFGIKTEKKAIIPEVKDYSSADSSILRLKTATKIYVNLAEPELAEETAKKNVDGVGLLRAEFMMAEIGIHPKKIIKDKKQEMFVDKLTKDLSLFCRKFSPRPVVYRASDFKTNEYRNLIGGNAYEPEEANPFIGYRGALRYLVDPETFELELKAIHRVREKLNLKNLWLMIPFCRTPRELSEVKKIVVASGLIRSPSFKLWLMVEIPSNVILLDDFLKIGIDGVSIGSNDLTMLMLGVDRDNPELAKDFSEMDPAVLWAIKKTIKTCHKHKITSSICGQAPSMYSELVEKLVEWGVSSISINPDAIEKTREVVYEAEKKIALKK